MKALTSPRLAWLLAMCISTTIAAQDRFELSDEDTWAPTRIADPGSPEGQLAEARRMLAENEAGRARALATRWIEQHEEHPLLPEAYLVRGDALVAQRSFYDALFDYEHIARVYYGSDVYIRSLERELDIARRFSRGLKRKLWGIRFVNADDVAEELFIRIQERLPGSELAEEAGIELGDFYFRRQEMSLAVDAYDLFIENYPNSELIPKARQRLIAANLAGFKGPQFDAAGLNEAGYQLRIFKREQPVAAEQLGADALLAGIEERRATKMLVTARWYLTSNDPIAAEFTLRRLVRKHPSTRAAEQAIALAPAIIEELPERIQATIPDYRELRDAARSSDGSDAGDAESNNEDAFIEPDDPSDTVESSEEGG